MLPAKSVYGGEVQLVSLFLFGLGSGRAPRRSQWRPAGGRPPSGLGCSPRCRTALCRYYAAGSAGNSLWLTAPVRLTRGRGALPTCAVSSINRKKKTFQGGRLPLASARRSYFPSTACFAPVLRRFVTCVPKWSGNGASHLLLCHLPFPPFLLGGRFPLWVAPKEVLRRERNGGCGGTAREWWSGIKMQLVMSLIWIARSRLALSP